MIHNYKIWKLLEHLGDGTETFTQKIDTSRKGLLSIYGCPDDWGKEITSATGTLTYTAELNVKTAGIEEIAFRIKKIELELEIVTGYDNSYEIIETREYVVDEIKDNQVTVEVYKLPYYLDGLEINFKDAENLDGELIPEKVMYELRIGNSND
jgi:hypothetical protein